MKKTIRGDKNLIFLDETLERRRLIRMHSQVKSHAVMTTGKESLEPSYNLDTI